MAPTTLTTWLKDYRAHGEAGLPAAITEKILQLKRANQWYGVKKIAHALQRLFMPPGSPETVRRRLHEAGLMSRMVVHWQRVNSSGNARVLSCCRTVSMIARLGKKLWRFNQTDP